MRLNLYKAIIFAASFGYEIYRFIVVPLLIVSVLMQTFATIGVLVQFEMNRKYYAEVLCINKNKPELACHGKCILMQRIQNKLEQHQTNDRQKLQNLLDRETLLFVEDIELKNLTPIVFDLHSDPLSNFKLQSLNSQKHPFGVFHPPIA